MTPPRTETGRRSALKAVTYRALIVLMDLSAIYLLTGKMQIALGFALISNIYTTVGYFFHERVWARIQWGLENGSRVEG